MTILYRLILSVRLCIGDQEGILQAFETSVTDAERPLNRGEAEDSGGSRPPALCPPPPHCPLSLTELGRAGHSQGRKAGSQRGDLRLMYKVSFPPDIQRPSHKAILHGWRLSWKIWGCVNQDLRPRRLSPNPDWVDCGGAFEHLHAGGDPERGSNLPRATQRRRLRPERILVTVASGWYPAHCRAPPNL